MSKANDMRDRIKGGKKPKAVDLIMGDNEEKIDSNESLKEERKEEGKKGRKEEIMNDNEKIQRQRVSFDIRTDLHKELKKQAVVIEERKMYEIIEDALMIYFQNKRG